MHDTRKRHLYRAGNMIETFKIISGVHHLAASSSMSMAGPNESPTRGHPYKLCKRRTKTQCCWQLFFIERVINVWNSLPSYIVETPSIKVLERRLDRYWRDQDIVCNYEAALSLGHSDWTGNDISPDSSYHCVYRSNDRRSVKT